MLLRTTIIEFHSSAGSVACSKSSLHTGWQWYTLNNVTVSVVSEKNIYIHFTPYVILLFADLTEVFCWFDKMVLKKANHRLKRGTNWEDTVSSHAWQSSIISQNCSWSGNKHKIIAFNFNSGCMFAGSVGDFFTKELVKQRILVCTAIGPEMQSICKELWDIGTWSLLNAFGHLMYR